MEFADNGDLYQKIVEHKKSAMFFEEEDIWRIFIQLVKGLKALHDLKILHRDLKSANVFLENDGSAKLGDLNVSKVAKRGIGYTQTGTPYYASPEVWKDQPYDNKSDIWSLGCVLYEMITLKTPFRAENMEGLYNKVIRGQYNKIPGKFSKDLQEVVRMLLQVSPQARPTCDQILKHPIIQKRIDYFKSFGGDELSEDQALLKTIRVPKNLIFLSDKLPKPNYKEYTNPNQRNNKNGNHHPFHSFTTDGNDLLNNNNKTEIPTARNKNIKLKEIKTGNEISNSEDLTKQHKIIKLISNKANTENNNEQKGGIKLQHSAEQHNLNERNIEKKERKLSPIRRDNNDIIKLQHKKYELPQLNIINNSNDKIQQNNNLQHRDLPINHIKKVKLNLMKNKPNLADLDIMYNVYQKYIKQSNINLEKEKLKKSSNLPINKNILHEYYNYRQPHRKYLLPKIIPNKIQISYNKY